MSLPIHFIASQNSDAQATCTLLTDKHGQCDIESASVIVAIGGDGTLLKALRLSEGYDIPVYGLNKGSVGFLMNAMNDDDLGEKIKIARVTKAKTIFAGREMAFFRKKGFSFSIFFYSVLLFVIPLFLSAYIYIIITLNYPQST